MAAVVVASIGTARTNATTSKSWSSSTATETRPCGASSSPRSASILMTTAVLDMATSIPANTAGRHSPPMANATPAVTPMQIPTWGSPTLSISPPIVSTRESENSSPTENSRTTIPTSASTRTASVSSTSPRACGPTITPATSRPTTAGSFISWNR